jgi:hypothetical protein
MDLLVVLGFANVIFWILLLLIISGTNKRIDELIRVQSEMLISMNIIRLLAHQASAEQFTEQEKEFMSNEIREDIRKHVESMDSRSGKTGQ